MRHRALLLACAGALLPACAADSPSNGGARRAIRVDAAPVVDLGDASPDADPLLEWPAGGARFSRVAVFSIDRSEEDAT
ncbi:MAG TPA: hypothetical protein VF039_12860 [Longimicrobiales bacterium]